MTNLASEVSVLEDEIESLRDENRVQHEHIVAVEAECKALASENDRLRKLIMRTTAERDNYTRCFEAILEQIARLRPPEIKPEGQMSEGTRKLLQQPLQVQVHH